MTGRDPPHAEPVAPPAYTLRLSFAYRGPELRLVGSERVAMIAPAGVSAPPAPGQSGHWLEVRDANDALLFHRVLANPMPGDVEVFAPDPGRSVARIPSPRREGRFELLVPDLPDARSLVLHGTPAGAPPAAPSTELLRIGFDELRKPRTDPPPRGRTP